MSFTGLMAILASAEGAGAHHYHSPEPKAIIVQFIGFTILALILARFAFPFLADALRKRRDGIKEGLDGLEREQARLHGAKSDAEKKLHDAERGSIERMEQAVKEGAALRDELVKEGDEAARKIAQKAKLEVEIERAKMVLELRNEVVELSFLAAAGVLREAVDKDAQEKLVDRFLGELDQVSAGGRG